MIVEIPCEGIVNPEKIVKESNMAAITEFRRRLANKGMPVDGKLVVDFDSKPGKIIVMTYPPPLWHQWFNTFSFRAVLSDENRMTLNLKNFNKSRPKGSGIKMRHLEMDDDTANEFASEGFI
jgi:hypothetical protein